MTVSWATEWKPSPVKTFSEFGDIQLKGIWCFTVTHRRLDTDYWSIYSRGDGQLHLGASHTIMYGPSKGCKNGIKGWLWPAYDVGGFLTKVQTWIWSNLQILLLLSSTIILLLLLFFFLLLFVKMDFIKWDSHPPLLLPNSVRTCFIKK